MFVRCEAARASFTPSTAAARTARVAGAHFGRRHQGLLLLLLLLKVQLAVMRTFEHDRRHRWWMLDGLASAPIRGNVSICMAARTGQGGSQSRMMRGLTVSASQHFLEQIICVH